MKSLLVVLMAAATAAWAAAGQLEVVVSPPEKVKRVQAILRGANAIMSINQKAFDLKPGGENGHFIVEDLPGGVYDIGIETVDQKRIEGVNLNVGAGTDAPVFHWWLPGDRLTADNYDPASAFEEGTVVKDEEKAEAVRKKFRLDALRQCFDALAKVKRFENYFRVIYASGTAENVKALVELRRDGGFYAVKGEEVVWRSEIWTFTWAGAWSAQNRGAKVLERVRIQRAEFDKFERLYDPRLGGAIVRNDAKTKVEYTLPAALDDTMGKARKTEQPAPAR